MAELRRIERQFAEGIKSADIVQIFKAKGYRFSEATLRKYVQLGLLPKSRRVGVRGRHRGSSGVYPVGIVRLINDIKIALDGGATLEEVRLGNVGLASELQILRKAGEEVVSRFREAIEHTADGKKRSVRKKALGQYARSLDRQVRELEKFASRIAHRTEVPSR